MRNRVAGHCGIVASFAAVLHSSICEREPGDRKMTVQARHMLKSVVRGVLMCSWGRERLPLESEYTTDHDMKVFPSSAGDGDKVLPEAETCFFIIKLPRSHIPSGGSVAVACARPWLSFLPACPSSAPRLAPSRSPLARLVPLLLQSSRSTCSRCVQSAAVREGAYAW